MKIFDTGQIRSWDAYTISSQGIDSLELMERASKVFVEWFIEKFPNKNTPIYIFCGNGNNGGDGLAISRLLHSRSYKVSVFVHTISDRRSKDNQANLNAVQELSKLKISTISDVKDFPSIEESSVVIDALFGTGLTKELHGLFLNLVRHLNQSNATRIAVDIPSGLFGDQSSLGVVLSADHTFSFEQPKLAFLFPENFTHVGKWIAESISLSDEFYITQSTDNYLITNKMALSLFKKRKKYDHKGSFGHSLLIMGSKGMIGAAVLSAFACLRSGSGLTTIYAPTCGYEIIQTSIPEALVICDSRDSHIGGLPSTDKYQAIGIGCGLGMEKETQQAVGELLKISTQPLVLDADALNTIASNPEMMNDIPIDSILTPHPKEFERLFGSTSNNFDRNSLQREKAIELGCFILLKGAHSCIATPEGICYYNSTGNPGMATAGSGDVLTGIITGLLAQGYSSKTALILGVYLHGLAGDLAAKVLGEESMIARDLIEYLPRAFKELVHW